MWEFLFLGFRVLVILVSLVKKRLLLQLYLDSNVKRSKWIPNSEYT
jgi:hypothetical protein